MVFLHLWLSLDKLNQEHHQRHRSPSPLEQHIQQTFDFEQGYHQPKYKFHDQLLLASQLSHSYHHRINTEESLCFRSIAIGDRE